MLKIAKVHKKGLGYCLGLEKGDEIVAFDGVECVDELDYAYILSSTSFLMLATYHRASFDLNVGKRRPYAFCSLAAIFFSYLSLIGSENILFFMSVAVWLTTDLCSLIPMPGFKLFQFPREDREC